MTDSTPRTGEHPVPGRTRGALDAVLRRTRRPRVALTFAVYSALAPLAFASFWVLYVLGPHERVRRARRMQRICAGAFRFMHGALSRLAILRFDRRAGFGPGVLPAGPCVVVANHPSRMDISSITAVLGGGCTVVKPAFFRKRSLRALMDGCWHIEGPGDNPLATGRVVDEAVERLRHGFSVIIFPEGTRTPASGLLPFGRTAFEIACRAKVPVVSVAVRCDPPWMTKETPMFAPPHPVPRLRLVQLATDAPASVDFESRALRQRVEARFQLWLQGARTSREGT
ncbi:MAG TPA: 1-acyl-sn-glycerol-3-phosphate acyltransferase [Planctomycetota bacterium]|nr:1-acyl-sn-glycerol-3-phosphate acyltransferase [Planctomycetota bacterium]